MSSTVFYYLDSLGGNLFFHVKVSGLRCRNLEYEAVRLLRVDIREVISLEYRGISF